MTSPRSHSALEDAIREHVGALCSAEPDRRPGCEGNRRATDYAAGILARAGWTVSTPEFVCLDWRSDGASLQVEGTEVPITPSPYGPGTKVSGNLVVIDDWADLVDADMSSRILVIHERLAAEPLTPKRFPFYGSEEHARIIHLLETSDPAALLAVTGKHPPLCGALDPFPFIEDGDVDIPSANLRPQDADLLMRSDGAAAQLEIRSERRRSQAQNVIATRGPQDRRITVVAHIDTKPGTPGAVDNAAGVATVLLLSELLSPGAIDELSVGVELLLVNGEDHYAAPGELDWLAAHGDHLDRVMLAINIDGAGYREGRTAFSTYNIDPATEDLIEQALDPRASVISGPAWYQSDHAIFAMRGRPALAFTTELVEEMLETLFHAPDDTPDQVDPGLVVDLARAIADLIVGWPGGPDRNVSDDGTADTNPGSATKSSARGGSSPASSLAS
jgi:aminopeptidase YwaD